MVVNQMNCCKNSSRKIISFNKSVFLSDEDLYNLILLDSEKYDFDIGVIDQNLRSLDLLNTFYILDSSGNTVYQKSIALNNAIDKEKVKINNDDLSKISNLTNNNVNQKINVKNLKEFLSYKGKLLTYEQQNKLLIKKYKEIEGSELNNDLPKEPKNAGLLLKSGLSTDADKHSGNNEGNDGDLF